MENLKRRESIESTNILNNLIVEYGDSCLMQEEWSKTFRDYKLKYYVLLVKELIKDGVLTDSRFTKIGAANRVEYKTYTFGVNSVSNGYMGIVYNRIRKVSKEKYLNKKKMKNSRPRTFSIANHGVSITTINQEDRFNKFTDSELVKELRDRGYTVTAEKTEVVETLIKL